MSRINVVENYQPSSAVSTLEIAKAQQGINAAIPVGSVGDSYRNFIMDMTSSNRSTSAEAVRTEMEASVGAANAIAKAFRSNPGKYQRTDKDGIQHNLPTPEELAKGGAISKATLDVGTLTNFANITGGQSLGYVSLDTQMARGTVRPNSFTLYQALRKTAANQIVDYWAYIDDTGGPLPGSAFSGFGNVSSGVLTTDVGDYNLNNITLKLMLDGRAMTTALAAQNSFVDIAQNESANAALVVLGSADWASYYGNPNIFPNQFVGIFNTTPASNIFDYGTFYTAKAAAEGWSQAQTLYNMIYEVAAQITSFGTFGRITHAFMTPATNASLQGLVSTTLNNILSTLSPEQQRSPGIVINGDLQGMRTRFGIIQFVLDLFIDARESPAQSFVLQNGTTKATTVAPTPPASVTVATGSGAIVGSQWTSAYAPTGSGYVYAVASTDVNMNESNLTYSGVYTVTAPLVGGYNAVTITPPAANDAYAFRVFRSGLGYVKTGAANTPYSFRFIGSLLANGSTPVVYNDLNQKVPGSEVLFLLDMAEEDHALDWRFLLPLTKVELFAQNLYMPWAVTMIGAIRNRIPKFHAVIKNYICDTPNFNPLSPNN